MLPRLMAVLQTAAFLFRHRAELVARAGVEPAWTDSESVLTDRPARDDGQRGWIRTTDPLLPRQVGTARLPYTLMIGLPGRTRTCMPSRS